jgi:hypothetical protein
MKVEVFAMSRVEGSGVNRLFKTNILRIARHFSSVTFLIDNRVMNLYKYDIRGPISLHSVSFIFSVLSQGDAICFAAIPSGCTSVLSSTLCHAL